MGTSTRSPMLSYVLARWLLFNQLPTCIVKVRQCPRSALQLSSSLYEHFRRAIQPGFLVLTSSQELSLKLSHPLHTLSAVQH